MTFENFKADIEIKLANLTKFELVEFHYLPYCFGNGFLVYRIGGQFHKLTFNGRENELNWDISSKNERYDNAKFVLLETVQGLIISNELLKSILEKKAAGNCFDRLNN